MPGTEVEPVVNFQPPSASQSTQHTENVPSAVRDRKEALARIATLVANGQIELPANLTLDELLAVVESVRNHRRLNLLRHIARCIACDIVANSKHNR